MDILKALTHAFKSIGKGFSTLVNALEQLTRKHTDRILVISLLVVVAYHVFFLANQESLTLRDMTYYLMIFGLISLHYKFGKLDAVIDNFKLEAKVLREILTRKERKIERLKEDNIRLEARIEKLELELKKRVVNERTTGKETRA